ncbi:2-deoxyribose-5-phosphate aldolase [Facklamia sp. HMSC062C11]|uniref:deoxyribose-phosphate aldolase n=1 Tax=Facklamia sp. HMSC062C11 TaxID=1739262 RepID=UPI0008A33C9D|nr:deoxyribose-phosphate aldolase [Facklamia sp. HMSC062C11]OFL65450.1 2-deoxyribose-5-phosphate aldolase [Facklamia sp. HMSC062C11]
MSMNQYIDHTLLKAQATRSEIERLCQEAKKYQFMSVCVNPYWVAYANELLHDTSVKVCTVIGFPLGANTSSVKAFEAKEAVKTGADEVDMVINVGLVKDGLWDQVQADIKAVVDAAKPALVKVIIETCLLEHDEIVNSCQAAQQAGADFVKTSTGFSTGGATVDDVALMRQTVGPDMGVKASGGIHTFEEAQALIEAGASRLGASKGVAIVQAEQE